MDAEPGSSLGGAAGRGVVEPGPERRASAGSSSGPIHGDRRSPRRDDRRVARADGPCEQVQEVGEAGFGGRRARMSRDRARSDASCAATGPRRDACGPALAERRRGTQFAAVDASLAWDPIIVARSSTPRERGDHRPTGSDAPEVPGGGAGLARAADPADRPTERPRTTSITSSTYWSASPALRGGPDAALDVVLEDEDRQRIDRGPQGGRLLEDVDAVLLALDHPRDAPDLALHPRQAADELGLVLRVAVAEVAGVRARRRVARSIAHGSMIPPGYRTQADRAPGPVRYTWLDGSRRSSRPHSDGVTCTACGASVPAEWIRILANRDDLAFVELDCAGCGSRALGSCWRRTSQADRPCGRRRRSARSAAASPTRRRGDARAPRGRHGDLRGLLADGQVTPAFAHASEAEMARILDFYAVRWEYEPHTFPILWNLDGDVVESFSPDFYLPDLDLYLEMTTLRQKLVRKKNRKLRRLRELYPTQRSSCSTPATSGR